MKQQENRAEPQEKQIRFIDSHYNLKFYIPDGGKIRITFRDGHTADRVCKHSMHLDLLPVILQKWD